MTISGKGIRTMLGVIAITALAGLGSAASPAMAQSPGFGFGEGFDEDDDDFFFPDRIICMSDRQIRQSIADRGYTQVSLNVPHNKRIQVRATRDGTVYLIKFNYCTGRIENRDALRRAQ